ncbi:hypothetical protein V5O48_017593 [Marasmius crinis-equi]|uniref:Uncharacterized protein n=1 Tax=Marasmius crinis-equi TaxID=585013 RepID=A0ABR3ENK1_9AGAR
MPPGSSSRRYLRSSSSLYGSQHFKGARNVTIGDHSNFSNVRGDQKIYINTEGKKKKKFIVGTEEEEAEYDEFVQIKRGDMVAVRTLHRSALGQYDKEQQEWVQCGEDMVVAGKVMIGGASLECTVVSYSGSGAEERWKRDFRMFGGIRRPENAQLVAINLSTIPMLVLTGDLVPAAHLNKQVGGMGNLFLGGLIEQMRCFDGSLWLDTSRGVFCRGPKGPWCDWLDDAFMSEKFPLDAELLQEDVMVRYLASKKLDRQAVLGFALLEEASQIRVARPTIISTRTNTILAVGSGGRWKSWERSLGEMKEMPDGATRFILLTTRRQDLRLEKEHAFEVVFGWAAQVLNVFHAHGVPLEGDLREYKLIVPPYLEGTLSQSKAKRRRRRHCPPIYLFFPPFSATTFWSFDHNGQNPIPDSFCTYLGLPIKLSATCNKFSWETPTYRHLRDYQIARGFDPTTTDFARHNECQMYDIVAEPLPNRLEEVDNSQIIEMFSSTTQQDVIGAENSSEHADLSLGILFGDIQPEAPQPDIAPTKSNATPQDTTTYANMWSGFMSKFSWAAVDDLDIHAAGF